MSYPALAPPEYLHNRSRASDQRWRRVSSARSAPILPQALAPVKSPRVPYSRKLAEL